MRERWYKTQTAPTVQEIFHSQMCSCVESGFLCTELVCLEEPEPDENPTVTSGFGSAYPCLHCPGLEQCTCTKQFNIFTFDLFSRFEGFRALRAGLVWPGLVRPCLVCFSLVWSDSAWSGLGSEPVWARVMGSGRRGGES